MTAKNPRFKPRVGWAVDKSLLGGGWIASKKRLSSATHRVRVTDARDLTAEQAIAKCINQAWISTDWTAEKACKAICPQGYSARIVNGKVRVRRDER